MKGLFITIEGSDGSGKSTQIELLKRFFENNNIEYILTREPGGTIISEAIRDIILDKNFMEMSDTTEVLLYAASRAQHVKELIIPSLEEGKVVLCDRFVDSSVVYQGYARGLGVEKVKAINEMATEGLIPDLTILLDLDVEKGLERKKNQKELDRLESQKLEFHKKVVDGYRRISQENKDRFVVIDATKTVEDIHKGIVCEIQKIV